MSESSKVEPLYKLGFILEFKSKDKTSLGVELMYQTLLGRKGHYIKILGVNWEKWMYKIAILNGALNQIPGSTHLVPINFVDRLFKPHVIYTLEHLVKEVKND